MVMQIKLIVVVVVTWSYDELQGVKKSYKELQGITTG